MEPPDTLNELKQKLLELSHLQSVNLLLEWDQQVNLPKKGHEPRAALIGHMSGLFHEKLVSPEFRDLVMKARDLSASCQLSAEEMCIVREVLRLFNKASKLPKSFIVESARACSEANQYWVEARKRSDFKLFLPYLSKIIALKIEEANLLGSSGSPYDALLDEYEPGMTSDTISIIFEELKNFLVPFIEQIKSSGVKVRRDFLRRTCPVERQRQFAVMVVKKMGFDFNAGRLDLSVHPFCTDFHPNDVRMTVRYDERDFTNQCLFSAIHEAGHGLYCQGLPAEHFGTPLAEEISMGIHESQSRLWENMVGRSIYFWEYFYPKLQKLLPVFRHISLDSFYAAINYVEPSLIRVDADEVTYNLHVVLRFEVEKALIEGAVQPEDLPEIWNQKMMQYFDIRVPNDAKGVLQDCHWADGLFGYFPTYGLGNLYAAQFYNAASNDIPHLENRISKGNLAPLRKWLRKNIHVHGSLYTPNELLERTSGETLNSSHFISYITKKYSEMYQL